MQMPTHQFFGYSHQSHGRQSAACGSSNEGERHGIDSGNSAFPIIES